VTDFDRRTVEEFRANGGRAGGVLAGTPLVLVHHIGARSGIEHVTPLAYLALGEGIVIAASNGGSPKHPAWYHNLKAHPAITVELGTERFRATAEEQAGPARAELWSKLVAQYPDLATFAASTERTIPLFLLRRGTLSASWSEESTDDATSRLHGAVVAEPERGVRGGEDRVDLEGRKVGVESGDLPGVGRMAQFGGEQATPGPLLAGQRIAHRAWLAVEDRQVRRPEAAAGE
jgi:deazaflavin-dependent oxidoreductase (nitroreductase family)